MFTTCVTLLICAFAQAVHAQTVNISELQTAGRFLDACGASADSLSKKATDALQDSLARATPDQVQAKFQKAMSDSVADEALCLGYLTGLKEGWEEGHVHGVEAVFFPDGVALDISDGVKSLSTKELEAANKAMNNDVPCLPEHATLGDLKDGVIKYMRDQIRANPVLSIAPTSRLFPTSLRRAFPCTNNQPSGSGSSAH
jgi:hypothetical protein